MKLFHIIKRLYNKITNNSIDNSDRLDDFLRCVEKSKNRSKNITTQHHKPINIGKSYREVNGKLIEEE